MAIQNYIGWPAKVNRVILDSSSITMGENALQTDNLEGGGKRSSLKGGFIPDKYSVKMEFNWADTVRGTGKTELQLFLEWYKYKHKYGSVPFEFPAILYSPSSGILKADRDGMDGRGSPAYYRTEFYKITSAVEGAKSGYCTEVTMTWESVYGGTVTIDTPEQSVVAAEAGRTSATGGASLCYMDVMLEGLADEGATVPVSSNFKVYYKPDTAGDWSETTLYGLAFDGNDTIRLYFLPDGLEKGSTYRATFSYAPERGAAVAMGTFQPEFIA